MIQVFCHYGMYNPETDKEIDDTDILNTITFYDENNKPKTIPAREIADLQRDTITVNSNGNYVTIPVDKVIDWD